MKIKGKAIPNFVVIGAILFIVWFGLFEFWLYPSGEINTWLNKKVASDVSFWTNKITDLKTHDFNAFIKVDNGHSLGIGNGCNGLELFVVFSIFIIAYPGKILNKVVYLILGNLIIHALNLTRVFLLLISVQSSRYWFELNHKFIFVFFVYTAIFGLWVAWVKYFHQFSWGKKSNE